MNVEQFQDLLRPVTDYVSNQQVNAQLEANLNDSFPPGEATFNTIEQACSEAILAGWMCSQGGEGRRFGRIIEPGEATGGLSVDVVELTDIVGPHHHHPTGEICMIMPVTETALFDGAGRGWCVFEPGTDHRPTVTHGRARVLYMLPGGKIEFSGN